MNRVLLATALMAAIGAPAARAADTAIIIWNTSDPLGAEIASGTGSAAVLGSNLDGVAITVSRVETGTNPNDLTEANLLIDNTTGSIQTIKIIAGANGYTGSTPGFEITGTIGATLGGSDLAGQFFAVPTNALNGLSTTLLGGAMLSSFNSGALLGPQSFSFNGAGPGGVSGPYGMAEELTLTLQPGATVFVQGVSMTAGVPEPSTWAMLLAGFGLIGAFGWRKRAARFAV